MEYWIILDKRRGIFFIAKSCIMPPGAESKYAMDDDSLKREIVSFMSLKNNEDAHKGKIVSWVENPSKINDGGLFEDKDNVMLANDQRKLKEKQVHEELKHMKEKQKQELELIISRPKNAAENLNTRPIGPLQADARLASSNGASEHGWRTNDKHGEPIPTKFTVANVDTEGYIKNSGDSAEAKNFSEVTKEKSESGVKTPVVKILRTRGKESTHVVANTIEVQMQISEEAMKMSILANDDTNAKVTCIAPGLFSKIQESGNIVIHAAKVPEILGIDGIKITSVIVATGSEKLVLGTDAINSLGWGEGTRLGDIYRQSQAERGLREQSIGVKPEYKHIFGIENTCGTVLGEQSNNVTAKTVETLPSANEVQKIFGIEDTIGNNLLGKGFSIAEANANSSNDSYGVDTNAPEVILRPTELPEASKNKDQNIFACEDIICIRPYFEVTHEETEMSGYEDINGNNLIRKEFSMREDDACSLDDNYGVDTNAPEVILRPTELPEASKNKDQNIFACEDISHGVDENVEATALESIMGPTELAVASTGRIAEEYLDIQITDAGGIILPSESANNKAKRHPARMEDKHLRRKSLDLEWKSLADLSETLPELICEDNNHNHGMMDTEADLLSRD